MPGFRLVALIDANTVNPRWDKGDFEGAVRASHRAKAVAIVGLVVDALAFVALIALAVLAN